MTNDASNIELLRQAIDRLEAAYERRRTELQSAISDLADLTPEDMRDSSGRSILLDALTTLVNARAALALAEKLG